MAVNETVLFVYGSEVSLTCNLTIPVKFYVNGAEAKGSNYEIIDINMKIKKLSKIKIYNYLFWILIFLLEKADLLSSYFCNNSQGNKIIFHPEVTPRLYKVDALNFFGVSGEKVSISCYVLVGYQNNLNIEWTWKDSKGESLNSTERFEILNKNESSTLTIQNSLMDDSGVYECIAKNAYGSHSRTLNLTIKSNLAPLWPFLGTLGQLIVLTLILLYYEFGIRKEFKFFKRQKTAPLVEKSTLSIEAD